MADYGYPFQPLYLPWGYDPSHSVFPEPNFPPYPQDYFVIPAGYDWIPGPVMPVPPEVDLALLYGHAYGGSYQQPYAYHYPPSPPPPPQANDGVHLGIPLVPVYPTVSHVHYLPPLQVNVTHQVVVAGTGVFHPPIMSNHNNNVYGAERMMRGGRWRGNRQRRFDHHHHRASSSVDARASTQNNTTGGGPATSSQEREGRG